MSPPGTTQTFSDVSFRGPPFMQSGPCTAAGRSRELKQRKFSLVLLPRLLHGHCAVATIAEHDVIDPFHEARGDGVDTLGDARARQRVAKRVHRPLYHWAERVNAWSAGVGDSVHLLRRCRLH